MKKMNRFLSILLCIAMVVGMLPVSAFAQSIAPATGTGSGDMMLPAIGSGNAIQPAPGSGNTIQPAPGSGSAIQPAPGSDYIIQPAPGSGNDVIQPAPGSGNDVIQPAPGSGNDVIQPAPGSGNDVIQPAPGGGNDVIQPAPGSGNDVIQPAPGSGNDVIQPAPGSGNDVIQPAPGTGDGDGGDGGDGGGVITPPPFVPSHYQVKFNTNGHGTAPNTQFIVPGGKASRPADPHEDGWFFDGWYTDAGCSAKYDFSTPVNGNITLYAKWSKMLTMVGKVTVTFNMNGHGKQVASQTMDKGGLVIRVTPPTEAGWVFGGWYMDAACTVRCDFSKPVENDMTVYAKWTSALVDISLRTVTFNMNGHGEPIAPQLVTNGLTATKPADPTEEGWMFSGWYTDAGCTAKYDFDTPVTGDITLYAKWGKLLPAVGKVTVTFHLNGHGYVPIHPQEVTVGEKLNRPGKDPWEDGWKFGGWYLDAKCTKPYDFSTPVTADFTLYAKWTEDIPDISLCTVTFDMGGHGNAIAPRLVSNGLPVARPGDPAEAGWIFLGWYADAYYNNAYDFSTPVTGNITLYAKWRADVTDIRVHTVSFDMGGHGEPIVPQEISSGCTARRPADPTEAGWYFDGWYVDAARSAEYDFATPVTQDITLYAKWLQLFPLNVTVTFHMNGHGEAIEPQSILVGGKATRPADPSEDGWLFGGWYTDAGCTAAFDFGAAVTVDLTLYAKWTRDVVDISLRTVTFDMGGHGTPIAPRKVSNGLPVTKPADPSEEGWRFQGWYTDAGCTAAYDFLAPVTADITLYAKWLKLLPNNTEFTITFEMCGHGTPVPPQVVAAGDKPVRPADPSEPGWVFQGWYANAYCDIPYDFDKVIGGDITLYAKWSKLLPPEAEKVTVTFDMCGHGEAIPAQTMDKGGLVITPVDPTEEGWRFDGWYVDAAYSAKYDFTQPVETDITLYAKWLKLLPNNTEFTITFEMCGHGTPVPPQVVAAGDKPVRPADPSEPGWVFQGWYANAYCDIPYDFDKVIGGDITLYAKWSKLLPPEAEKVTVTFDMCGHGEAIPAQTMDKGGLVITPVDPTEEGWRFGGWYVDAAYSAKYDFTQPVETDITLYAKWLKLLPNNTEFTITFDMCGHGTPVPPQVVAAGDKPVRPADPSEPGWVFQGWYANAYCDIPYDFDKVIGGDITLYAKWSKLLPPEAEKVTVTFDMCGHGKAIPAQTMDKGGLVITPVDPTEEGWRFHGWYVDAAYSAKYDFTQPVETDITLYAKWGKLLPDAAEYTVTFHMCGHGVSVTSQTVKAGEKAVRPASDPDDNGWNFLGWYTDEAYTAEYDFDTPVTSDLDLYAKWGPDTPLLAMYTVTFDLNGHGEAIEPQLVVNGALATKPANPSAEDGWLFEGWFTDAACTAEYDFDTPVTGDITLYAKWVRLLLNTHTVAFDLNGHGEAIEPQEVESGALATKPADPTEAGWHFAGWYADAACTAEYDFTTPVTEDITLYAKWLQLLPLNVTVTFDLNGHGKSIEPQELLVGDKAARPEDPTEEGWRFIGWYVDAACTNAYDFSAAVTADLTLYAKWAPEDLTVEIDPKVVTLDPGATQQFTVNFTSSYEYLDGFAWSVAPNARTGNEQASIDQYGLLTLGANASGSYTVTVTAVGDPSKYDTAIVYVNVSEPHLVQFDLQGHGAAIADQKIENGGQVAKPADPAETGWDFGGWYTDAACTSAYDFASEVTGSFTLYAKWTQQVTNYTVTYDPNGGSGTMDIATVASGTGYALADNGFTAPSGKTFKCWSINGTEYIPGQKITVTSNVTVIAVWEAVPVANARTMDYVPKTGDGIVWLGMMLFIMAAVGGAIVLEKKKY